MESFSIKSATGPGSLEFFDRFPTDPNLPIERFWARMTDRNLSATVEVSGGYAYDHPAPLFAEMAGRWRGWPGELQWRSPYCEMSLSCTQDRTGHVSIRVDLCSGPMDSDWLIRATVMSEAGQLEEISRHATAFFGQPA